MKIKTTQTACTKADMPAILLYLGMAQALIDLTDTAPIKRSMWASQTVRNFLSKAQKALIDNLNRMDYGDMGIVQQATDLSETVLNTCMVLLASGEVSQELSDDMVALVRKHYPETETRFAALKKSIEE
jgi:spore coat protein U-like protein